MNRHASEARRTLAVAIAVAFAVAVVARIDAVAAGDRVSYTSSRPGGWDIYLFDRTGAAARRLTADPGLDYDPVVSPDGRWVVFTSERRGGPDLYALDLMRHGEPHLLVESDALEDQAAFSPDGKSVVFVSTVSGNAEIYLMPFRPRETSKMSKASNLTQHPGGDFRPAFSPDGQHLAFSSDRDSAVEVRNPITRFRSGDIYVLDLSGGALRRVTTADGWDGSPAWSPDGNSIAFYSERNPENRRPGIRGDQPATLWIMNADGSRQRELTSGATTAVSPAFLADGRIVFAQRPAIQSAVPGGPPARSSLYDEGVWQIVSIAGDGSDERVESDGATRNYWQPRRGPAAGSIIAYGTTPDPPGTATGDTDTFGGRGAALVEGAPFRKRLADRVIDLYPLRYFSAALNPDADVVLYTSPPPGNQFQLSSIDGRDQRPLQHDGEPIASSILGLAGFQWSRDGQWLAFSGGGATPTALAQGTLSQIWTVRGDGSDLRNLTPNGPGYSAYPSISRDGKQIVFRSGANPGATIDLYLMNADGSNVRQLTDDAANDLFPKFSPAADQIVFLSNRDNPTSSTYDIYLMTLTGEGAPGPVRRITNNDVQEGHVTFSYDGEWLMFSSEMGGLSDEEPLLRSVQFAAQSYGEMYAYRLRDGLLVRLTHNKWEEGVPSWEKAAPP